MDLTEKNGDNWITICCALVLYSCFVTDGVYLIFLSTGCVHFWI